MFRLFTQDFLNLLEKFPHNPSQHTARDQLTGRAGDELLDGVGESESHDSDILYRVSATVSTSSARKSQ